MKAEDLSDAIERHLGQAPGGLDVEIERLDVQVEPGGEPDADAIGRAIAERLGEIDGQKA